MVSILLVDDHPILLRGLRALLENEPGFEIIGSAVNGHDALKLAIEKKPDVMIVDLMIPGISGLEITRRLNAAKSKTKVIILSMHDSPGYVLEALNCGASGYVLKGSEASDLITAIKEVTAGRRFLSAPLSGFVIDAYLEKTQHSAIDPYDTLTDREKDVLYLVAEGHTNAEIAGILHISRRTVETHRANLMKKLKLNSQAELIRYAIKRGIISVDI